MYVGRDVPHDSARGHVTGESVYIDDMPPMPGELLVDFVWSSYAHARIRGIDFANAATLPGVVALYTYHDLVHNQLGPIIHDEPLLAEEICMFRGQPIVVIAAESRDAILAAKNAIKVDLEELKPILTIDDAI